MVGGGRGRPAKPAILEHLFTLLSAPFGMVGKGATCEEEIRVSVARSTTLDLCFVFDYFDIRKHERHRQMMPRLRHSGEIEDSTPSCIYLAPLFGESE